MRANRTPRGEWWTSSTGTRHSGLASCSIPNTSDGCKLDSDCKLAWLTLPQCFLSQAALITWGNCFSKWLPGKSLSVLEWLLHLKQSCLQVRKVFLRVCSACISFGRPLLTCSRLFSDLLYGTVQGKSKCREKNSGPDGLLWSMHRRGLFDLSSALRFVSLSCRKPPEYSNGSNPSRSVVF